MKKKNQIKLIVFLIIVLGILFFIYFNSQDNKIPPTPIQNLTKNETLFECEHGLNKCEDKIYSICDKGFWKLEGETPGECGVPIPELKKVYYRLENNSCSSVDLYNYEITLNDYINLTICSEKIFIALPLPLPEPILCTDSDGLDFMSKGTLSIDGGTFTDYCYSYVPAVGLPPVVNLQEYYCSSDNLYQKRTKDCKDFGANYTCEDGKCVNEQILCKKTGIEIGTFFTSGRYTPAGGGDISIRYIYIDGKIVPSISTGSVSTLLGTEFDCAGGGLSNADYALSTEWIGANEYITLKELLRKNPPCLCSAPIWSPDLLCTGYLKEFYDTGKSRNMTIQYRAVDKYQNIGILLSRGAYLNSVSLGDYDCAGKGLQNANLALSLGFVSLNGYSQLLNFTSNNLACSCY